MLCKFHYYVNYNLEFVKLISIGVQHGNTYLKLCARLQMKDIRIVFIIDILFEKECKFLIVGTPSSSILFPIF